MAKDFEIGFIGGNLFYKEKIKLFQAEWSKMTDSKKLELMNKQVECMGDERFSVETIDAFCEEWWEKSSEEKQTFVDEWEQTVETGCKKNIHTCPFGVFSEKKPDTIKSMIY